MRVIFAIAGLVIECRPGQRMHLFHKDVAIGQVSGILGNCNCRGRE